MKNPQAKAGSLICVDRGEYSDYGVTGFFVALAEFDPHAELEQFLVEHPDQRSEYAFEADEFLAALIKKGLLLEITYSTMHLCNYSKASEFAFYVP